MAYWVQLMARLGPQIIPGRPAKTKDVLAVMTRDTGQTEGEAMQGIINLIKALLEFFWQGCSVHIDDLGTFTVELDGSDGSFNVHFRPVPALLRRIKAGFTGRIKNKQNIGKSKEEMAALWNADPANADNPYIVT